VANLKVSGTYQLADTEHILKLLARSLPVRIDYRTRYWVVITSS
jgi:transmembrane sensor